jgi:phosphoribosylamine--glycine ligase
VRAVVVGSGGREHALAWRLSESASVRSVRVWPGNGGTAASGWSPASPVHEDEDPLESLLALEPDLLVIGPEAPLVEGLADALRQRGVAVFGPGAAGARLEGSKIHAKRFMEAHGIPTAVSCVVSQESELTPALDEIGSPCVLKADGLAAGKGVILPASREEALAQGRTMLSGQAVGAAGRRLLVEERLEGFELSLLAVCDGTRYFLLPSSQDHKRAHEGDRGPNTGGMGAYSPVPALDESSLAALGEQVFAPSLRGLAAEGIDYRGVLYAGLMMGPGGPRVLEFNCRFGDPETQVLLPRLTGDFGRLLAGAAAGELPSALPGIRPQAAITVVLASAGYPGKVASGFPIAGLEARNDDDTWVFHAGTRLVQGQVLTAGGRVLAVTALGRDLAQAAERCYRRIERIRFQGRTFRRDIGWRVLSRGGPA